ncbi:MAG: methyltransferase [Deltaproteobacteria bacterium]|nr:methyltransferase [Deltaproteobacteria bacterium]
MFQVTLHQPTKGYRYNIDSLLLSKFAKFKKNERVCDLGCGVGILGILALIWGKASEVVGVEVQEELARFAQQNIEELQLQNSFRLICDNWKRVAKQLKSERFDLILSNPPYRKSGSGRLSSHTQKIIAKHEVKGSLKDLLITGKQLMARKGRFCLIYPTLRLEEFIQETGKQGLKISRLQMVHPFVHQKANHFMVELKLSVQGEIEIQPALVVYKEAGVYTEEVEGWVGKQFDPSELDRE